MHARTLIALTLLGLGACSDDPQATTDATTTRDATVAPDTTVTLPTDTSDDITTPTSTCSAPTSARITNAQVPDGFCASIWASNIDTPRGLFVADNGDVLVVERGQSRVLALWDDDGDGVSSEDERAVLAEASNLNHGITVHEGFLYASRDTTVFRWPYTAGMRADLGSAETVVKGLPGGGNHSTRTLLFDAQGRLLVSIGSQNNVDSDSRRARVVRFDLGTIPSGGIAFGDATLFADGLRNEVGLALDAHGVVWGVQNGRDELNRADLGGDIHQDNPAEILSRFDTEGAFHGYPYCFAEFDLPVGVGLGRNSLWANPESMNDGTHDDAWCRAHTQLAALAMQAHSAPLDLEFYDGASFPAAFQGDLFITFHGSWNRNVPTGYKVVHVDMSGATPSDPEPFFEFNGDGDFASSWPFRPVDVRVGKDGQLFVSSDASGQILVIGHE